jgi:gamma-glutamylcyclotransferase (GGCT)/AIG2-like uncharacterized protein YtfP
LTISYFAYGSNMSLAQMRERCPRSRKLGIGVLDGYRLVFPRYSTRRQTGAASIAPAQADAVWGVVYALTEEDAVALDGFEGFAPSRSPSENNYNRAAVAIRLAGAPEQLVSCMTYVATPQSGQFNPSLAYLGTILVGAEENSLPRDYIDCLRAIPVMPAMHDAIP